MAAPAGCAPADEPAAVLSRTAPCSSPRARGAARRPPRYGTSKPIGTLFRSLVRVQSHRNGHVSVT
jgi:hypothetical protein